jgi:hypothetical protein
MTSAVHREHEAAGHLSVATFSAKRCRSVKLAGGTGQQRRERYCTILRRSLKRMQYRFYTCGRELEHDSVLVLDTTELGDIVDVALGIPDESR